MKIQKKHIFLIILALLILVVLVIFLFKGLILLVAGRFLLKDMKPEKSDLIVALRGDFTLGRTLEAARLFKEGYGENIFISTALDDSYSQRLKEQGIDVFTEQQRLFSILKQLGIPEEKIILSNQTPGGGTLSELKRIREIIREKEYTKVIIVTSWYHTKRTYLMSKKVFKNEDLKFFVVAVENDISNSSDWWQHRYEVLHVFEEFPKLFFFYLNKVLRITFKDDPMIYDNI